MAASNTVGGGLTRSFGRLAVLGAVLVCAGLVGLVWTGAATLTSMTLFGWLLLLGGAVGLLHALYSRGQGYFWLAAVVAALNLAAGAVVLARPHAPAEAFVMSAALLFLTGGAFRLIGSAVVRGPQVGLPLVQGAFGLLLGVLVLAGRPSGSRYTVGAFISLALLFDGLGLIALGYGGRRIVTMVVNDTDTDRRLARRPDTAHGARDASQGAHGAPGGADTPHTPGAHGPSAAPTEGTGGPGTPPAAPAGPTPPVTQPVQPEKSLKAEQEGQE